MARVVLGLVLLTAASLKGYQLATEPVAGTSLLSSRWFLITLVDVELLFGVWLLSGLYSRPTWAATIFCFGGFAGVSLWKALSGEASCGCFGSVPVNPWWTFTFDLAAVGLLAWCRPATAQPPTGRLGLRWAGIALALLAGGVPGTLAMATYTPTALSADGVIVGEGNLVVLEPEKWTGKPFPLAGWIDVGERLVRGDWIVVLYHHDCPKCQEILSVCERLAQRASSDSAALPMALIEVPPYASGGDDLTWLGSHGMLGRLNNERDWFVETPSVMVLREGNVEGVQRTPSATAFETMLRDHGYDK